MRLATFNLENLGAAPKDTVDGARQVRALRTQIERLNADIICFQEVNADTVPTPDGGKMRALPALDDLLDGTPYAGFNRVHTVSSSGPIPKDRHNLVTLSRFPIIHHREIHHHLVTPPLYNCATTKPQETSPSQATANEAVANQAIEWDRPFLHTVLDAGYATPLHVINVHLRAPRAAFVAGQKQDSETWNSISGWAEGFFLTAVKRAGQALEVRLFVDALFDENEAALIAIAGDFNADEHEVPARIIRGDDIDIGNPVLLPRVLASLDSRLPRNRRRSVIHAGREQMLDHIFASPALDTFFEAIEAHNDRLGDEVLEAETPDRTAGSFHAPVVATLKDA